LCIGAHPDDVELGMGGTVAKHSRRGDEVTIVICTQGIGGESGDPRLRESEARKAADILGAKLHILDYPVLKLNTTSPEFTGLIRHIIQDIKPDRLYTHSPFDYHQVHETVSAAVLQSCWDVPQVLLFEESSSTTSEFRPNAFVDITDYMEFKVECIKSHNTQSKKLYMQENIARSLCQSRYVLSKIGKRPGGMAEAFTIWRFQITYTKTNKTDPNHLSSLSPVGDRSV
jgi:LmbE family N-acetylglucosaminyl deacetylase